MNRVQECLGVPYHAGGRSLAGLDCLGVVLWSLGIDDPGRVVGEAGDYLEGLVAWLESEGFQQVYDQVLSCDVIVFRSRSTPHHLAVMLDETVMVHAHSGMGKVIGEPLVSSRWSARIYGRYRRVA